MDNKEDKNKIEINQLEKDSNQVFLFGKNRKKNVKYKLDKNIKKNVENVEKNEEKNNNEKTNILNIDLKKLENKLDLIKYQLGKEKDYFINELGEYGLILSEKEYEIRRINQENDLLQLSIKSIRNEVNNKKKLNFLFNTKNLLLDNLIKAYQNKIKLNENTNINIKMNIDELNNDINLKKNLNNSNYNELKIKLNNELNEKNKLIDELTKNISNLKNNLFEYKVCEINKNNNQRKVILLKEEYNRLKYIFPFKKISKLFQYKSNFNFSTINSGKKSIEKIFNNLNKTKIQKQKNELNKSNSVDNLFKNNEKKILSYLIPEETIIKFQNKFNNISNEKSLIEYELKREKNLLIEKNEINKSKCIKNQKDIHKQDIKNNILNQKILNTKIQIMIIKKNIRNTINEYKNIDLLYKEINKDNKKLKTQIKNFKELIKEGKLRLKQKGLTLYNSNKVLINN